MAGGIILLFLAAAGFYYLTQSEKTGVPINKFLAAKEYNFGDKNSRDFSSTTNSNINNAPDENSLLPGKLFVEVKPWADVYIDNKKIDTTPLDNYINLSSGIHTLKLVHPDYPPYIRKIRISSDKIEAVKIDFQLLTGYLDCKVLPWGEVFINGNHVGTTPLRVPINLFPGNYEIKITNPQYVDPLEKQVEIAAKETLVVTFNFESSTIE